MEPAGAAGTAPRVAQAPGVPCPCTTSNIPSPLPGIPAARGAAVPAHSSELPGNLPHYLTFFHNYTTNEEVKSCLSASSSLLEKQALPGGSEVGRQECMSFWALWVLGTFQSSHAAAKEFSNLTGHPVLWGQQTVVVTVLAGTQGAWQMPGLRLCPLLLLPVSSLLPSPYYGHLTHHIELLPQGQSCHQIQRRAPHASRTESPALGRQARGWGGQAGVRGQGSSGGHACAIEKSIISPDFELGSAAGGFCSWRTLQRFVLLRGGGEGNSFFCYQAT